MGSLSELEKMLYGIDFSQGHQHTVKEKINARLQASAQALSLDELDDAAGGLAAPRMVKDEQKNPIHKPK